MSVTERHGGGRYRKFRARILARDPGCTEPDCRDCHKRLTGELRDELGLPFAPNGRTAPLYGGTAEPMKTGPRKVWEGAISIPIAGPAIVIDRDGVVRRIRRGEYG